MRKYFYYALAILFLPLYFIIDPGYFLVILLGYTTFVTVVGSKKQCPRCKNYFAAEQTAKRVADQHAEFHENEALNNFFSTEYEYDFKCRYCGNEWTQHKDEVYRKHKT